jgi:cell division protein FtsL
MGIVAAKQERAAPSGSARSSRRGIALVLALLLGALTTAAILQVWMRLKAIEYGYKISRATDAQRGLLEANRALRIELTLLKDPARIARIATTELGMLAPRPEQVRRLRLQLRPDREADPVIDEDPGEADVAAVTSTDLTVAASGGVP